MSHFDPLLSTSHCSSFFQIHCLDITLEDTDVVKALTEYASFAAIENLVLGAPSRSGFLRKFKGSDVPSSVSKSAPDFCTVYVIYKGKISAVRNASRPAPYTSPLHAQIQIREENAQAAHSAASTPTGDRINVKEKFHEKHHDRHPSYDLESVRGKELRRQDSWGDISVPETDISFVSSARPSVDQPWASPIGIVDSGRPSRVSTSSDHSIGSARHGGRPHDLSSLHNFSSVSNDSARTSNCSSESMDEVEAEMKRLREELKHTMDMYSTACKDALSAKQKATELSRWRKEEEKRLQEARLSEEAALAVAQKERAKYRAAMEAAQAHQKVAELEAQKRLNVEMKALSSTEEMKKAMGAFYEYDTRYRRYTIEEIEAATDFFSESRKIGEGGYGPVYKCYLDHTQVAIKVLRPDAAQGRAQFQQEIEVLSCIRHPNMVLLLGACPEYGCLVYEYMANGSLEDRLFQLGNTPPIPWQIRFRIAAEIATGLLFLHQTKPEPLVHRDLKPANILLDHNYSSKISDVGLARLVPPSVADSVTQYRMTSTAGTFCYIDPEYQQTGMLGVKSDVYSLGILLLQLITGKNPMGLTYHVEKAIESGTFSDMLDASVTDWPMEETLNFAKLALQCAELRRKDRPDLGGVVLPELNKLRELADQSMPSTMSFCSSSSSPPRHSGASVSQDGTSHTTRTHSSVDE
ncbi:hypothetical protein QQ045_008817 [Rhodiola kirilowii]